MEMFLVSFADFCREPYSDHVITKRLFTLELEKELKFVWNIKLKTELF